MHHQNRKSFISRAIEQLQNSLKRFYIKNLKILLMIESKRVYDAYRPSNFIYNKKNLNNQNFTKSGSGLGVLGLSGYSSK